MVSPTTTRRSRGEAGARGGVSVSCETVASKPTSSLVLPWNSVYLGTLEVLVFGTLVLDVASSRNAREKLASPFLMLLKTLECPLERPPGMQVSFVHVDCSRGTASNSVDVRTERDNV